MALSLPSRLFRASDAEPRDTDLPQRADEASTFSVALRYYDYASNQLALSLRQRDATVLLYLAAVGTLFAASFVDSGVQVSLLVLIPFLGLGAAMLTMLHHVRIGALSGFREDLHAWVIQNTPTLSTNLPPHKDTLALARDIGKGRPGKIWAVLSPLVKAGIYINQSVAHFALIAIPGAVATLLVILVAAGAVASSGASIPTADQLQESNILKVGLIGACSASLLLTVLVLGSAVAIRGVSYRQQQELPHLADTKHGGAK